MDAAELHDRIATVIATRGRDEWAALFDGVDACVAPVLTMGEAPSHPHAVARAAFADVEGVPQPAPAPRFDRTPAAAPTAAVEGADAAELLADWGIDTERWVRRMGGQVV